MELTLFFRATLIVDDYIQIAMEKRTPVMRMVSSANMMQVESSQLVYAARRLGWYNIRVVCTNRI